MEAEPKQSTELPSGWELPRLSEIAQINPRLDRATPSDGDAITFVPMRAVEEEGGGLLRPETRPYGEVKKGYTAFRTDDVIMAKITPCMENGKTTVVPNLPNQVCFGSTEFHVVRPEIDVQARWIAQFLLRHDVRRSAKHRMTGGVGQMRVPAAFLDELRVPLAPTEEQLRIAEILDEILPDLDAGVASLVRVREKLKLYRASVLKAAVDGTLSTEWRAQHPEVEPASELLKRILIKRRRRWEEDQLAKLRNKKQEPPKNWKSKYKEPQAPETTIANPLPKDWCWATVEQLAKVTSGQTPAGMPSASEPDGTVSWFRVGDMNIVGNETFMESGGLLMKSETATRLGAKLLPAGTIIFPKRGGAIATNKKRRLRFAASCDLNLMAVTPEAQIANYLWLYFLGLDLASLSDGSNVPQINNPDICPRFVALPPRDEQEAIVEAAEDHLSVIDHLETDLSAKLNTAQGLRQSILRHAFSGKLVPQNPNDEPASRLLKRISIERESRSREFGKINRPEKRRAKAK